MPRDIKLAFASILFIGLGFGLYGYLIPLYARDLGANPIQIGLLYTVFFLTATLVAIPGGLLADRFELKTIIVLDWLVIIPAVLIYYFAPSWPVLLLGEFVAGLSMLNSPAMSVYINRRVPKSKINTAFTFVYSSFPLGMVVSPAIGGYLATRVGIKNVFLLALVMFIISSVIILFISPQPHRPAKVTVGVLKTLRHADFQKLIAFFTVVFLVDATIVPFISPYLNSIKHFNLTMIGVAGAAINLGAALLGPLLGRLADRAGGRRAISIGLLLAAGSLAVIVVAGSAWPLMLALFIYGLFNGVYSIARGILSLRVKDLPLGVSYGVFGAVSTGASFVGPYVGGLLFTEAPALPFISMAALALVMGLVVFVASFRVCRQALVP